MTWLDVPKKRERAADSHSHCNGLLYEFTLDVSSMLCFMRHFNAFVLFNLIFIKFLNFLMKLMAVDPI